jgi:hypothetical protein
MGVPLNGFDASLGTLSAAKDSQDHVGAPVRFHADGAPSYGSVRHATVIAAPMTRLLPTK